MMEFNYHRPQTLPQAISLLEMPGAAVMAGGTDLMVYLRGRRGQGIEHIIDLTYLPELDFIRLEGDEIHLGPLVTHTQLAQSHVLQRYAGPLAQAAAAVGSPQIRNRGTLGGNIANAAVCADTAAPLVALGAQVKLEGPGGVRTLTVEDLILGPNRTQLDKEVLTEISFTPLPEGAGWGFVRLARREALAIARMNVAVVLERAQDGSIKDISIAPGSVLPSPARITQAEEVLLGKKPTEDLVRQAGEAVAAAMISAAGRRWSTDYKEPVVKALVERAIKQALGVEWK